MNFTTTHIRSEKVTIDTRIYTILNGRKKPGEVYLAAIAPDMELTIITLDEAPGILPCFEEDDACLNLPNTSLLLCYNPAQVLKMGGKHYLTGPVILVRTNMDGEVISLTIDEVYLFQKYLASHSITLMADDQKLPCICMHYNPFAYVHSEKDILKLVTTLMTNTKGEGSGGDPFWEKSERLLLTALIAYLHYEAPVEEQNFATLLEMLNTMQVLEDDEEYQNPVDLLFEELAKKKPNSFAGRQYKLYKLAAGVT